MKKLQCLQQAAFVLLFVFATVTAQATNYYFSSTTGDDSRSNAQAQNEATPWRTLARLNAIFSSLNAGDVIYLKRGDVFEGSLRINASGNAASPILITAYGTGARPVISGFTSFTNWTSIANNVWQTDVSLAGSDINMVLVNGVFQPIGRYPNSTASNNGYLTIESYSGNTSISNSSLSSGPDWDGGEVVIRKNRWIVDRNSINNHNGNTLSYTSGSGYHATTGYGFFIQNHPAALDRQGEWFFRNKKFGVYYNGSPAAAKIEASVASVLVSINNQTGISFSELEFRGANRYAFDIKNSNQVSIINCDILYSGENAVEASNSSSFKIESTTIDYANNIALNLTNCSGTTVKNNTITNTATVTGMGNSGDGTYEAILVSGNNNLLEGNTIENTGYVPISFSGSSVTVKNNVIKNFTLVKDDGGGIYTWNNSNNPPVYTNRVVSGNMVLNGHSANEGATGNDKKFSHGIYLDDNTSNVEVIGNTVASCEGFGIYVHNASNNSLKANTVYNNTVQIALVHDDIAPNYPIRNMEVSDNIFFSLHPSQLVAEYKSKANDIADFGNFSNNYYARPFDDNTTIGVLKNVGGSYNYQQTDVEGWRAMYGKDAGSKASPKTFLPYAVSRITGSNQYGNGNFNNNIGGLYAFSPANNCQTAWRKGVLDGGSLAVSFSGITNNSKGTVVIGVGSVTAGKKYLLRFTLKGSDEHKWLDVYLRKSGAPYNDIADRKANKIRASRQEVEWLFTANESTNDASIGIDVPEQSSAVHFDNIELKEVAATEVNMSDSVKFVYNATATSGTTSLDKNYVDVKSAAFNNSITLIPYTSAVLLAGNGVTVAPPQQVNCSGTGSILREQWNNINGNDVQNIPLQSTPSSSSSITAFEGPQDAAEKYGSRIRGYICPPQTGSYTFFIAGDDATELWLSTSDNPSGKVKIAYSLSWTGFREWNKYASQKSVGISLEAGKKYYIEALHKEGNGGDHVSVAWQLPDGVMEAPIAGSRLSPFQVAALADQTITFNALPDFILGASPLTLTASASSGLPVNFSIVSGAATLNGNTLTPTAAGVIVIKASQGGNSQYNAATDVTQTLLVTTPVACDASGSILHEQWYGVGGNDVSQIPLSIQPSLSFQITTFEVSPNTGDSYGRRIRGYICAPQTGNYTFFISGDDGTELWLSTDGNPSNKARIAYSVSWTNFREWNRYVTQKSASIYLEAGKKYYIEALQKEGAGGDHLSVAWQLPGGMLEAPIAGRHLSPYVPAVVPCSATGFILREVWNNVGGNDVSQIPLQKNASAASLINQFEGPANAADNYGSKISGYICAPQTGTYTFWIAGDDATELWLSSSDKITDKKKVAYNLSWTDYRQWDKYATQKSEKIYLEAGKKYYIEALQKEGGGGDHLSVAWQLPDGIMEAPIAGKWLAPYLGGLLSDASTALKTTSQKAQVAVEPPTTKTHTKAVGISCYPNPFAEKVMVDINAPQTEQVTIEVFDVVGKKVAVLYNGVLQKLKPKRLEWTATYVPSGVYFVHYSSQQRRFVYKLVKE